MSDTYAEHADVCVKFYELTADAEKVGNFIIEKSGIKTFDKVLFVGGMFHVAKFLVDRGFDLQVVDYTDEMVRIGNDILGADRVNKADLKLLPFDAEFDLILVIGRVFTHMISNDDLVAALGSCRRSLRNGGKLFFDNYEDSKISVTSYFNGSVGAELNQTKIQRTSSTTLITSHPYVVLWSARYTGVLNGLPIDFSDAMEHRAFSRSEIVSFLDKTDFAMLAQGNNFDETSFFTLCG